MLIFSQRIGETVLVGGDVKITVQSIKGNPVRLGIDAPKDVPVNREEVYRRIKGERPTRKG